MRKICITLILLSLYVFSINAAYAKTVDSKKVSDTMWRAVEGCFHLSNEYHRGNNTYEKRGQKSVWILNWTSSKRQTSAWAEIDADTQIISSFNRYDNYEYGFKVKLPTISKEKARQIAEKAINTLDPNKLKNSRLSSTTGSDFAETYFFTWTRVVFGVPFPENHVSVAIDGQTGKISSYTSNWNYNAVFPAPNVKLNAGEARQKILHSLSLRKEFIDEWNPKGKNTFLAYLLPNNYGGLQVDALKGAVVNSQNIASPVLSAVYGRIKWQPLFTSAPLTSKEDVLAKVYPFIQEGYKLSRVSSYGNPNYGITWSVEYNKNEENISCFLAYTFTKKGDLLSYNSYASKSLKTNYTRQQCLEEALKYVGKYYSLPDKENLYLVSERNTPKQPMYYFNFVKKIYGYPYFNQTINVGVSAEDLSLCNFNINMEKAEFKLPKKVKPAWEVLKTLIPPDGVKLQYKSVPSKAKSLQIYLMYVPQWTNTRPVPVEAEPKIIKKTSNKKVAEIHIYEDMKNKVDEKTINNLTKKGIIRSLAGSLFKPNAYITKADFVDMVVRLQIMQGKINPYNFKIKKKVFRDVSSEEWYYVPVYLAYQNNLLPDKNRFSPQAKITKEEMAFILARALGYTKLVSKDKYFRLPYLDSGKIAPAYAAEVVLMDAAGTLPGKKYYHPHKHFTRLEAAKIIAQFVK